MYWQISARYYIRAPFSSTAFENAGFQSTISSVPRLRVRRWPVSLIRKRRRLSKNPKSIRSSPVQPRNLYLRDTEFTYIRRRSRICWGKRSWLGIFWTLFSLFYLQVTSVSILRTPYSILNSRNHQDRRKWTLGSTGRAEEFLLKPRKIY